MNPAIVQIAVFLLAILSVGGIVGAALYPLLAGESRQKKRLQSITTKEPSDDMVEVAIVSLLAALTDEQRAEVESRGPIAAGALAAVVDVPDAPQPEHEDG